MDTKPMFGAWQTPHKGQLQDLPTQETMNWDGIDWIGGAAHETNTREVWDMK